MNDGGGGSLKGAGRWCCGAWCCSAENAVDDGFGVGGGMGPLKRWCGPVGGRKRSPVGGFPEAMAAALASAALSCCL